MLIQQTLIQYLLQKKNLCEIFKVLTIWGNINLFIRPQHRMHDADKTGSASQMRRVPGKLHDRIRRRMEKQGVKFPLIGVDQGIQFSWTGKYQMVIIYIQNTFPLCVDP